MSLSTQLLNRQAQKSHARVWTLTDRLCTRTFRVCTPTLLKSERFAAQRGSDPLTWISEIRSMFFVRGFGRVWHQHSVGKKWCFKRTYKQRLIDTAAQNWHSDVITNHKLNMYSLCKSTLEIEQCRILRIHGIDRQVRFCKYCLNLCINLIEDEHHVLLMCPLFNDVRQRYIAKHFRNFWPSDISFVNMMSNKSEIAIRDLAVFIYHMFNIHAHFNSTL